MANKKTQKQVKKATQSPITKKKKTIKKSLLPNPTPATPIKKRSVPKFEFNKNTGPTGIPADGSLRHDQSFLADSVINEMFKLQKNKKGILKDFKKNVSHVTHCDGWIRFYFYKNTPIHFIRAILDHLNKDFIYSNKTYRWGYFTTKNYMAFGPWSRKCGYTPGGPVHIYQTTVKF